MNTLIWGRLIIVNTAALFSVLFWEGIASACMIFALWKYSSYIEDSALVKRSITLRIACSLGYLMILYRGVAPDFWSSTVGNLLLFYGFYQESLMVLTLLKLNRQRMNTAYHWLWFAFSAIYLAFDLLDGASNYRIALASLTMFSLFLPLVLRCLLTRNSPTINRILAVPYLLVVLANIPRCLYAFMTAEFTIHTTNIFQTVLCLTLLSKSYFGTLFFFLLLKMDSDKEIKKLALTDGLTGLINRRSYFETGNQMLEQSRKKNQMFGVFFLDIDSYKTINDLYGHAKGDEILIAFAQVIMQNIRDGDICCRYGGDEFSICVFLPNPEVGDLIAERILEEVHKIPILPEHSLTTSIGLAYGIPKENDTFEYFVNQADKAMYVAKQSGKNRLNAVNI